MKKSLREMYEGGMSVTAIAVRENLAPKVVRQVLEDSGTLFRRPGRPRNGFSVETMEEGFERVRQGTAFTTVADALGIPFTTFYSWCRDARVYRFGKHVEKITNDFLAGRSPRALAKELKMPIGCVTSIIYGEKLHVILLERKKSGSHANHPTAGIVRSRDEASVHADQAAH